MLSFLIDVSDTGIQNRAKPHMVLRDGAYKLTMWEIIMWKSCKSEVKAPATVMMSFIEGKDTENFGMYKMYKREVKFLF